MREERAASGEAADRVTGGHVVTVGTFDGIHRGHRDVLARLTTRARDLGLPSLLVTFDPHPLDVVHPGGAPDLLTLWEEKLEQLAGTAVDRVVVLRFTPELARYTAVQFVQLVLRQRFGMRELFAGYDHGFGRDRGGDPDALRAIGAEQGFRVDVVPPVRLPDGSEISSSVVRQAVTAGDLDRAARALGRRYSVSGRVQPGAGRGRTMGYPTLNLGGRPARKLLPPEGVYAVRVDTPAGPADGMMNLGTRPTFGDLVPSLEVHLFDVHPMLYGAAVRVEFVARLRDTMRFAGPDALREQLGRDETSARAALTRLRHPSVDGVGGVA